MTPPLDHIITFIWGVLKMLLPRFHLKPKAEIHITGVVTGAATANPKVASFNNDLLLRVSVTDVRHDRAIIMGWTADAIFEGKSYSARPVVIPDTYVVAYPSFTPLEEFDPADYATEWPLPDIRTELDKLVEQKQTDRPKTNHGWLRFVLPAYRIDGVTLTLTAEDQFRHKHTAIVTIREKEIRAELWDSAEPRLRDQLNRMHGPRPPHP